MWTKCKWFGICAAPVGVKFWCGVVICVITSIFAQFLTYCAICIFRTRHQDLDPASILRCDMPTEICSSSGRTLPFQQFLATSGC
jgi:hypothetical protein